MMHYLIRLTVNKRRGGSVVPFTMTGFYVGTAPAFRAFKSRKIEHMRELFRDPKKHLPDASPELVRMLTDQGTRVAVDSRIGLMFLLAYKKADVIGMAHGGPDVVEAKVRAFLARHPCARVHLLDEDDPSFGDQRSHWESGMRELEQHLRSLSPEEHTPHFATPTWSNLGVPDGEVRGGFYLDALPEEINAWAAAEFVLWDGRESEVMRLKGPGKRQPV